ncbi:unnamed protein product [Soboliphyme baturini]|uniref:CULLIN_2 domain-containing protein n=1 Tax=Soboliphyme baturini TaxID=241478 RepID=A0A183ICT2_9BILA|nr:unnamed protein product [Soboliphyme baturini]
MVWRSVDCSLLLVSYSSLHGHTYDRVDGKREEEKLLFVLLYLYMSLSCNEVYHAFGFSPSESPAGISTEHVPTLLCDHGFLKRMADDTSSASRFKPIKFDPNEVLKKPRITFLDPGDDEPGTDIGIESVLDQSGSSDEPDELVMADELKTNFSMLMHSNGMHKASNCPKVIISKKLMIKNLIIEPAVPVDDVGDYAESTWKRLEEAVKAIQHRQFVATGFEELFQSVDSLCANDQAEWLYERLRVLCEEHIRYDLRQFLDSSLDGETFLKQLNSCWQWHCDQMVRQTVFGSVCFFQWAHSYVYAGASSDMGLDLFRNVIVKDVAVEQRTVDCILQMIDRERHGDTVDRLLLKSLLRMLSTLQIYAPMFEGRFLTSTAQLYAAEGQDLVQKQDVPSYLAHVKKRLGEELERVYQYLDYSTRKALISCVEHEMIAKHVDVILEKGFEMLMDEGRSIELSTLHDLVSRVTTGLTDMKISFVAYIKRSLYFRFNRQRYKSNVIITMFQRIGTAIVMDVDHDKTMVQELLDFKDKLDDITNNCFGRSELFLNATRDSFEFFINQRLNKPAELIAKFLDAKLRIGNKAATEEELERLMDKVMVLFRFIHGKDVFEAFYKKDLAKRLLLGKSASVDAEKSLLSKLKQECGSMFTSKLEGMFKDMELSKELGLAFKQFLNNASTLKLNIDMTVNILTMGNWPTYIPMDVNVPLDMVEYLEVFKKFYLGKHSGRKLQWQYSLGQCLLKARFRSNVGSESKPAAESWAIGYASSENVVENQRRGDSAFRVLRNVDRIQPSVQDIIEMVVFHSYLRWFLFFGDYYYDVFWTQITFVTAACSSTAWSNAFVCLEDGELRRTLQSLACGKFRVILKTPRGRDVDDGDRFIFNEKFDDKLIRIKINQIQMKETKQELQQTTEQIYQDRQYQIDAAIVRIMKMRKILSHNLLISELYSQLRFPVKPVDLKRRIESLIERDYMNRDTDDSNSYHYVATMGNKPTINEQVITAEKCGVLQLSGYSLKELPPKLLKLKSTLRSLDISSNRIVELAQFIGQLDKLKKLNLNKNRLKSLPQEFTALVRLEVLTINNNELMSLPYGMCAFQNLKVLEISHNMLQEFPIIVCQMKQLDVLDLSMNKIESIPDGIEGLNAMELNMNQNQLRLVSERIVSCPRLKVLRIEENCLSLEPVLDRILRESTVSLLCVDGNLFDTRKFQQLPSYDIYMERYTRSKKKLF